MQRKRGSETALLRAGSELFPGNFVAPCKEALRTATRASAGEEFAKPAERPVVLDWVFEPAGSGRVWKKFVGVLPIGKRPGDHDVAKVAAGFAGGVLGAPVLGERAGGNAQSDARAGRVTVAGAGEDAGLFSGEA
jgi:hypothetical protein